MHRLSTRLACGTSLIALASITALTLPALADSFVVDTPTVVTNGDAGNVLDGNDTLTISNGASITVTGAFGVSSTGVNDNVINKGLIETNGDDNNAIHTTGTNATVTNFGTIIAHGRSADGIFSSGSSSTVYNFGEIQAEGDFGYGIHLSLSDSTAINTGKITTSGTNSHVVRATNTNAKIINYGSLISTGGSGIHLSGADSYAYNYGKIMVDGSSAHGIVSSLTDRSTIFNSGEIVTSGVGGYGIVASGADAKIINTGKVSTTGVTSGGLLSSGDNLNFENLGSLLVSGANSRGVVSTGLDANIINRGLVLSDSGVAGDGIQTTGDNATVANTGKIIATEGDAFEMTGTGGVLNLNAPSFVGGVFNIPGSGVGTTELNITTGASHSVLWTFDPSHLDGGAPNVSGNVPGFYDAATGRFATYDPTILAIALDQLSEKTGLVSDLAARKASGDDIWVSAIGNFSNIDGNDSTLDRDTASAGIAFGASRQIRSTFRLNGMFGYLNSKTEASSRWTEALENKTQSFFASVNGDFARQNYDLNFGLTAGFSNSDNRRFVNDNLALTDGKTLGQSWATSKYSSWWFSPEITVSRDIERSNGWTLTPLAQARYSFEAIQSATESGSNANATVASRTLGLIEGKAEIAASKKFDRIKFTARAGVQSTVSVGGDANITLIDITRPVSNGFDNRLSGYLGADLNYKFNDKTSFNISSKGVLGGGVKSASIFANLTRKF